jgi:hypothetical protein
VLREVSPSVCVCVSLLLFGVQIGFWVRFRCCSYN